MGGLGRCTILFGVITAICTTTTTQQGIGSPLAGAENRQHTFNLGENASFSYFGDLAGGCKFTRDEEKMACCYASTDYKKYSLNSCDESGCSGQGDFLVEERVTIENDEIRVGHCILHLVGGAKISDNGSYVVTFPGSPFFLYDSQRDRSLLDGRTSFKILVIETEEKSDWSLVAGAVVGVLVVVIVIGLATRSRLFKTRWSPNGLEAGEHTEPKGGARSVSSPFHHSTTLELKEINTGSSTQGLTEEDHHLEAVTIDNDLQMKMSNFQGHPNIPLEEEETNAHPMFSIFPQHRRNGLESLMKTMEIENLGVMLDNDICAEMDAKWEEIMSLIIGEKSVSYIHYINEIFDRDNIESKAFTAYNILNQTPNVKGKKGALEKLFKVALKGKDSVDSPSQLKFNNHTTFMFLTDEDIAAYEREYFSILEKMLPMRALALKNAIKHVYQDPIQQMAATYHVLERYSEYSMVNMEFLFKLSDNQNHSVPIQQSDENSIDFELIFTPKKTDTDREIRNLIMVTLKKVKTKDNLITWLNQEYGSRYKAYGWPKLTSPITKEEFVYARINVEHSWYGQYLHHHINFLFRHHEGKPGQEERLVQLKNFFQLALENIEQLIPCDGGFILNKKECKVKKVLGEDQDKHNETLILKVKEVWDAVETQSEIQNNTVTFFHKLGDQGVPFNTADKIHELLTRDNDVDSLQIEIQKVKKSRVRVLSSGSVFVWAHNKQRLSDMTEDMRGRIKNLVAAEVANPEAHGETFDRLLHMSGLLPMSTTGEVMKDIRSFQPEIGVGGRVQIMVEKWCDMDRTVEDLLTGFSKITAETVDAKLQLSMEALKLGIQVLMKQHLKTSQTQKVYPQSIDTWENFVEHVKNSIDGRAMKDYLKMSRDQFLIRVEDGDVKPGDMIMLWRKTKGVGYAHAGIFLKNKQGSFLIHVQPSSGMVNFLVNKQAEVRVDKLEDQVKDDDKIFGIRWCKSRKEQDRVLLWARNCLLPDPVRFKYNGYYGSCQTFCAGLFNVRDLKVLNLEAFFASTGSMKAFYGSFVNDREQALDLLHKIEERRPTTREEEEDDGSGLYDESDIDVKPFRISKLVFAPQVSCN